MSWISCDVLNWWKVIFAWLIPRSEIRLLCSTLWRARPTSFQNCNQIHCVEIGLNKQLEFYSMKDFTETILVSMGGWIQ